MIAALMLCAAPHTKAETIELRANATVRDVKDDQDIIKAGITAGDPVVIVLTYDLSATNSSSISESAIYELDSRMGSFSISVGDLTWKHDFSIGDLKTRVFNDFEPPSPSHDRFDVSGYGVNEETFPFAQAGLNYFNLQLIDRDGSMIDSFDLPDDQTKIDVDDMKFANGVVQARAPDSKIIWSFQYFVDDVSITRAFEPETSVVLSIAFLLFVAFVFCILFILVIACVAYLIPQKPEQEEDVSR